MATSGKYDLSSVSPDKPLYNSTQRGPYTSASLDRSSSFRENMENPILSSLPSMSRSTSTATHVDVTNFLQCLRFDPKSMAVDHKFNRHGEFRRLASSVLGSPDESPSSSFKGKLPNSSPDDLKRLKAGLRESSIKARERVKAFSETLSVMNKCFPSIPSRKRSRPDGLPGDRASGLLLNRAPIAKMGNQSHSLTNNAFDFEQQKVEERGKNVIPNKRTRTSMVDVRPNTPARSSGNVDREKEALRIPIPNSNALQGEDRASASPIEGWEKTKMKKKRTGIKVDAASSPSSGSTKANDGYREPKQGMHPRHLPDSMSRLNDSHGFRGAANGVNLSGKTDGSSHQTIRPSIPRPEQDNTSLLHDKRDRSTSSEKERTNLRSVNKSNVREEFLSGSPTSGAKLHTNPRAQRSGSNIVPKSSTVGQRTTASSDYEPSHGTNKNFVSTNRKRTPSSPPVAQWADRRPQKISRTARRTNLIPILSNNSDEPPDTSDVTASESGSGFTKRFKSKGDHFPSSALSESEESGAAEIRSRDKGKKCDEVVEKGEQNVKKMLNLKNKVLNGKDVNGVRRQNRTGRGFGSVRAGAPVVIEKIRNVGTAKQLRTARLGFDKSESKSGRPPTRKLADRKAYTRQKHTTVNVATDFLVGSDDGHEQLLAAAKSVIIPNRALSSPFWRQMEPLFGFLPDVDISYLKQQGSIQSIITTTNPNIDTSTTQSPQHFTPSSGEMPLCQRLLAALISEEEITDVYGSAFEFETDVESNAFNHGSLQNFEVGGHGPRINSTLRSCKESMHTGFDHSYNGLISDPPGINCSEYEYGNLPFNERLLIEIQSIGLYPELVLDLPRNGNEGISAEISRLEEKHHQQVSRKKSLLNNLLQSANEARELQEKEFEQHCLEKLTAMAYQKYMSCWGPNASGGKSVNTKMAKQAAIASVRRTLDHCRGFEATGKSCFNEPLYKEIFHSRLSNLNNNPQLDTANDVDSCKVNSNSIERESGTQTQLSPSLNNHEQYSTDVYHPSEQNIGKEENIWSNRVKKRELYLDDVVGAASSLPPSISNNAKGKRSERDREGKNGPPKMGRPVSGNVKGERKTKTKLKQKTTQLSTSLNGPMGKISDRRTLTPPIKNKMVKEKEEIMEEPLDFSHLQIPEMDVLGEQGEDIGSWLNIDDEILQDEDFLGLEIPMDDLSDLNMMV